MDMQRCFYFNLFDAMFVLLFVLLTAYFVLIYMYAREIKEQNALRRINANNKKTIKYATAQLERIKSRVDAIIARGVNWK